MADASQNRFLENIIEKARGTDATFVIANCALKDLPIIYCSPGFANETGFTRSQVTRKHAYCDYLFGRKTTHNSRDALSKAIISGRKTHIEMILYDVTGAKRWYLVSLLPVTNSEKEAVLLLMFFRDINHMKPPLLGSPRLLWKTAVRKILKKPNFALVLSERRRHKKKPGMETIMHEYNKMFIPNYGREKMQYPKNVIPHVHPLKSAWDVFIFLLILNSAIYVPINVCFHPSHSISLLLVDISFDIMFFIDIVLTMFTTYVDNDGNVVLSSKKIRRHYARSWLLLDIISALPFSLIQLIYQSKTNILSVVRIFKIVRLMRLGKASGKVERFMQNGVFTLGMWIVVFCLCAHWMACIWYLIAYYIDDPVNNHLSWLHMLGSQENKPFVENELHLSGPSYSARYVSALYYTMSSLTTCGFGNIAPNTTAEKIFGVVTMLIGCVLYAFIFGQVTNIIAQMRKNSNEFSAQFSSIQQFNEIYKVPVTVRRRVENYFVATWAITKGTDEEEILRNCPRDLQADLCLHIHKEVFENDPAFRLLSQNALRALSRFFWSIRTAPGDKLIFHGERVDSTFFVTAGSLEVKHEERLVGLIGPGDSFGERPVNDNGKSVYDVIANSFGIIHVISCEGFNEALSLFPEELQTMKYALKLSFDITREFKDKTKQVDKRLETPETEANYDNIDGLTEVAQEHAGGDVLNALRRELRSETEQINAKMGVVEAQMRILLRMLRNKSARVHPELNEQLNELSMYDVNNDNDCEVLTITESHDDLMASV